MSDSYQINKDDFTGKELEEVIAALLALPVEGDAVEVPEKFANKGEQADFINKLVAIHGLAPKKATEEDLAANPDLAKNGAVVGGIILLATGEEAENSSGDDKEEETKEESEEEEKGDGGDSKGDEKDEKSDTQLEKKNEPNQSKNRFYKGEVVLDTQNRLINGKMYVEVRTVTASYTILPEEAKKEIVTK